MTNNTLDNESHALIARFLVFTENYNDDVTSSIKCTIVQFLSNVRLTLSDIASTQNGFLSSEDILGTQIEVLQQCIIDLNLILERFKNLILERFKNEGRKALN